MLLLKQKKQKTKTKNISHKYSPHPPPYAWEEAQTDCPQYSGLWNLKLLQGPAWWIQRMDHGTYKQDFPLLGKEAWRIQPISPVVATWWVNVWFNKVWDYSMIILLPDINRLIQSQILGNWLSAKEGPAINLVSDQFLKTCSHAPSKPSLTNEFPEHNQ